MQNKLTATNYQTKLEVATTAENISAILDAKLNATSSQGVVDYVGLAIDNIDSQVDRMKLAIAELNSMVKIAEIQKDIVKMGVANWLVSSGVEKLDGDIISSMKVTTPKAKESLVVTDTDALINQGYFKTAVDKTAVKKAINDGVEIEGATIEVEHQGSTLTIYKKRSIKKYIEVIGNIHENKDLLNANPTT